MGACVRSLAAWAPCECLGARWGSGDAVAFAAALLNEGESLTPLICVTTLSKRGCNDSPSRAHMKNPRVNVCDVMHVHFCSCVAAAASCVIFACGHIKGGVSDHWP